jgi:putative transposase
MKQKRTAYRRNGKVVWGRYNSRRKPGHDYRSNGYYFVTLNTKYRLPIFGEVVCGSMLVSRTGANVWVCWNDIPLHFPFVRLDACVVMPDHVHAIIVIAQPPDAVLAEQPENGTSQTLGSIVRGWKVGVRNRMKAAGIDFDLWQRGFHDRIICSDEGLWRTRRYIADNPKNDNRKKRSSVGAKNLSPRLMTERLQKPSTHKR